MPRARRFAVQQCRAWALGEELTDIVALLVTELVTNVVLHAETPGELNLGVRRRQVEVRVADRGRGPSAPRRAAARVDPSAEGGRGLLLLERLATQWGQTALEGGHLVWFTLPVPRSWRPGTSCPCPASPRARAG